MIAQLFRDSSARILAALVRILGDLDAAEDALQEAFRAAAERWPIDGVPENPRAWLISVGKFRGIDQLRRGAKVRPGLEADEHPSLGPSFEAALDESIPDDTLRLMFLCCHPGLALEARVALTLREVCGMTTEQIAAAFLVGVPTVAQRIVRAKAKLRALNPPWEAPEGESLAERMDAVLNVVYLVFNEGYFASDGPDLVRRDLVDEAIRLERLLVTLVHHPDAVGLLGLMVLQKARMPSRKGPDGEAILLEDQNRSLWDRAGIDEGSGLVRAALAAGAPGPYTLQAAIAAVHATAPSVGETDWKLIVELYESLGRLTPSPVVELNRCIAFAMVQGPGAALKLLEPLFEAGGPLEGYAPGRVARGELAFRAGDRVLARREWEAAWELGGPGPLRSIIEKKLAGLT